MLKYLSFIFFPFLFSVAIVFPIATFGQMQFKQDSTVKRSDLSEFMAEVHFVSDRNNLQIQSTTSKIDIVDEKPIQRLEDDQYEYIAHLRLRTDDGDMHYPPHHKTCKS